MCTRPDLAFVTGILGRYQSNPGIEHWRMVKKALCYLQGTKGLMLTYRRSDSLHIEGYSDLDFVGDVDDRKSRPCIYSHGRSYIVEKLQANRHCIVHDVCQVNWLKNLCPG